MAKAAAFSTRTFRVVPPRWAHAPLSGDGAKLHGGRYNSRGTPAFYSALDPHTAYAEYTQALYDRPGLLCTFEVSRAKVIDLRSDEVLAQLDVSASSLAMPWLDLAPSPTQQLATRLIELGYDGALYRSLQHDAGSNLVMWLWNSGGRANIRLIDRYGEVPEEPLPRA